MSKLSHSNPNLDDVLHEGNRDRALGNPQTTKDRPMSMLWDERDNIILKLLSYAEHREACANSYAPDRDCDCGLQKLIERCEELGYGG